jgi:hypothetical protein
MTRSKGAYKPKGRALLVVAGRVLHTGMQVPFAACGDSCSHITRVSLCVHDLSMHMLISCTMRSAKMSRYVAGMQERI